MSQSNNAVSLASTPSAPQSIADTDDEGVSTSQNDAESDQQHIGTTQIGLFSTIG